MNTVIGPDGKDWHQYSFEYEDVRGSSFSIYFYALDDEDAAMRMECMKNPTSGYQRIVAVIPANFGPDSSDWQTVN